MTTDAPTPNLNGWHPIETVPNNVFDVLARYWDASLDMFLYRRFADCVLVNDQICTGELPNVSVLTAHGFRPEYWMPIPTLPETVKK